MATAPIITVKLEASDEREAIARFIEYTFDKNWVVQDVIDAIRDGSYLEHVRKLVAAQPALAPDVLVRCEKCNALIETTVHCDNCGTFEPTRR